MKRLAVLLTASGWLIAIVGGVPLGRALYTIWTVRPLLGEHHSESGLADAADPILAGQRFTVALGVGALLALASLLVQRYRMPEPDRLGSLVIANVTLLLLAVSWVLTLAGLATR